MINIFKKIFFTLIFILIIFHTYSKQFIKDNLKDYNIQTGVKISESTDKKFYLEIPNWFRSNIISQNTKINIIKDYLGNTLTENITNSDIYKFKCIFIDNNFYYNYTIEEKINCIMIIMASIKIYDNKNKLLLKLHINSRVEKITDNENEIEPTIKELLKECFTSFLNKINENENFINFLDNSSYSKIDDSTKYLNIIHPWNDLLTKNKNNYKTILSLGYQIDMGAYVSVVSPTASLQASYGKFVFEAFPTDLFSIEYQFDVSSLLFSLIYGALYNYTSIQINNDLYFNFNFLKNPFFCSSISIILGNNYNYFTSQNAITQYSYKPGYYYIEDKFIQNIHSFRVGIAYRLIQSNPYIRKSSSSFGIEICYIPTYNDYFNELYHGIEILFIVKGNSYIHIFREKPHKYVSKKYFQVR